MDDGPGAVHATWVPPLSRNATRLLGDFVAGKTLWAVTAAEAEVVEARAKLATAITNARRQMALLFNCVQTGRTTNTASLWPYWPSFPRRGPISPSGNSAMTWILA